MGTSEALYCHTVACNSGQYVRVRPLGMQGQVSCQTLDDFIANSRCIMYCMAGLSWTVSTGV